MDRRWGGVLVILVAVLAAVILPNVVGKKIPGVAVAAPVPGPPHVGDCLTRPETDSWLRDRPSYAPQALVSCTAARFGEVVAVIRDGRSTEPAVPSIHTPSDGSVLTDDPNQLTCFEAMWHYLGLRTGHDHLPLMMGNWSPLSFVAAAPSGPTALQKAAGQTWVACVLFLEGDIGSSVPYAGPAKDSFGGGTVPKAFAVCLDSADITQARPISCAKPHRVEAFGSMSTAHVGLTQQSLDGTCRSLAGRMTGTTDPTVGGQLQVGASAVHGIETQAVGLGGPDDDHGFAACLVVAPANHLLGGPLLGLGKTAIPWAQ